MRLLLLIIISFPLTVFCQTPEKENIEAVSYKDFSLGLNFHTRGWGVAFDFGKQKTYKYKNLYGFTFTNLRHPKEAKIYSTTSGARGYYFGKLNSLVSLRPTFGGKALLFKAERENGIEVSFKWHIGPSIGFLKPVYLRIDKIDAPTSDERYDPSIHSTANISSRSSYFKGFFEGKIKPGIFVNASIDFNFGALRKAISGGEVGVMMDYFPEPLILLHENPGLSFFPAFYLQFNLGQKLY